MPSLRAGWGGGASVDHAESRSQPQLHLRTHGDPGDMAREGARDIRVLLMAAVVADGFPEQAGRDADPDLEVGRSPGGGCQGLARVLHRAVLYRTCQPSTAAV